MTTPALTWHVDKTTWQSGPWLDEPDYLLMQTDHGYPAVAFRGVRTGVWHAYIRVPEGHSLHGVPVGEMTAPLSAHRGVNYAAARLHWMDTLPGSGTPGVDDDGTGWWFGWDYGHAGDMCPAPGVSLPALFERAGVRLDGWTEIAPGVAEHHGNPVVYRTLQHVRSELHAVSVQLSRLS